MFSDRLRTLRDELKQAEFARKADIASYEFWEHGSGLFNRE